MAVMAVNLVRREDKLADEATPETNTTSTNSSTTTATTTTMLLETSETSNGVEAKNFKDACSITPSTSWSPFASSTDDCHDPKLKCAKYSTMEYTKANPEFRIEAKVHYVYTNAPLLCLKRKGEIVEQKNECASGRAFGKGSTYGSIGSTRIYNAYTCD